MIPTLAQRGFARRRAAAAPAASQPASEVEVLRAENASLKARQQRAIELLGGTVAATRPTGGAE